MVKIRAFLVFVMTMLFVAGLSGCYLFPKEEEVLAPPLIEPPKITYETTKAARGIIEKKITGSGTFVSVEQGNMFFKNRGGRLKKVYVKVGDTVEKGELIAELDSGDLENQIKQQKIHLKKAETRRNQVRTYSEDKYERTMAQYDVDLAKLSYENLQRELNESKLTADMSGHVVYVDYNVREGDYINAYQPLVRVADPDRLQLQISGSNTSDFKLGMEADVIIKKKTYPGTVVMTPADLPLDTPDNLKDIVRIDTPDLPDDVKMGDNAQISLILDRREDVIIVPRNLVRNYMGRKYVLVLEDDLKKERDVEIGLETPTETEIMKGLEEGELIIIR
ncbi:MAG TPA: efflux RND transporter periplasmic adaptor subunit [Clostridia bacterium]|nr:efflux RND transporter periplasmic adaptor subunit [Clostridia bacterium]